MTMARRASYFYALARNWTWVRAGWQLGRIKHRVAETNRSRTDVPTGTWVVTAMEWDGRDWIVTEMDMRRAR